MENKVAAKTIENKEELIKVVKYIATETLKLAKKIIRKTFPIKSLTVFAHSQSEYELLTGILAEMGKPHNYNNGPRVELSEPIKVRSNYINYLRVRTPDVERPQIGCNDFEINYDDFKKTYLDKYKNKLIFIKRLEYEMIEFRDPDFDVLAYAVLK